ncbi:hypothetical protein L6452_15603 [Arctium lappa]|uniref:Uncharacterized protein n=1 Tax=Arctium lappa TaxID=4217 RepID=A0ACB9CPB8_ARCLA|nr:hypothetical protein L6452_15603 [Arctium lappa]
MGRTMELLCGMLDSECNMIILVGRWGEESDIIFRLSCEFSCYQILNSGEVVEVTIDIVLVDAETMARSLAEATI